MEALSSYTSLYVDANILVIEGHINQPLISMILKWHNENRTLVIYSQLGAREAQRVAEYVALDQIAITVPRPECVLSQDPAPFRRVATHTIKMEVQK